MGNTMKKRSSARRAAVFMAMLGALIMSSGVALIVTATPANAEPDPSVTFCHSTESESNPWELITTNANAFYQGHVLQMHTDDVYPSVTFTHANEGEITVPAQGDPAFIANDCEAPPEPEVCPPGSTNAGMEIPPGTVDEELFCNPVVDPPELCPEGTDNAGQEIPEGADPAVFCDDPTVIVDPPRPPSGGNPQVSPPTVTPTVVSAGLGDVANDMRGEQGLALVFAGMVLLLGAGGLGLRTNGRAAQI